MCLIDAVDGDGPYTLHPAAYTAADIDSAGCCLTCRWRCSLLAAHQTAQRAISRCRLRMHEACKFVAALGNLHAAQQQQQQQKRMVASWAGAPAQKWL